jgi:hypothetical protein
MHTLTTTDGDTTYHLSRPELAAILAFASDDETRINYYGCVFGDGQITATDGHRAVRVKYETQGERPGRILVPKGPLLALLDSMKKKAVCAITVAPDGIGIGLEAPGFEELTAQPEDVVLPPIDQVIPIIPAIDWKGAVACFNTAYLFDLRLVSLACEYEVDEPKGKKSKIIPGVVVYPPEHDLAPILCTLHSPYHFTEWTAVIMPMKM